MDDFLILGFDKDDLRRVVGVIQKELAKVKLTMNSKSTIYNCMLFPLCETVQKEKSV